MGPPRNPHKVATSTLRAEARVWLDQSKIIEGIVGDAEELKINHLEAGIFQLFVGTYDSVIDQIAGRCGEGKGRMTEIASALNRIAAGYDETERKGEELFTRLF